MHVNLGLGEFSLVRGAGFLRRRLRLPGLFGLAFGVGLGGKRGGLDNVIIQRNLTKVFSTCATRASSASCAALREAASAFSCAALASAASFSATARAASAASAAQRASSASRFAVAAASLARRWAARASSA